MKKNIVILGPLGQDGKLLSSILDKDNYNVFGVCKENTNSERIKFHEEIDEKYYFQIFLMWRYCRFLKISHWPILDPKIICD